jgi:hypothetical protein
MWHEKPMGALAMILTKTPPYVTTGEPGDTLGVQSWRIARLFELGILPEPQRLGGRRLIPRSAIPEIVDALRARGWIDDADASLDGSAANPT